MRQKILRQFMILLIFMASFQAEAWSMFGSSNYDDCILENIKNAQGPQAVAAVRNACRSKFPIPENEICEEFLNSSRVITFDNLRNEADGYKGMSDQEIIDYLQSRGVDTKQLVKENHCKKLLKK